MAETFIPTLAEVAAARQELGTRIRETPIWWWRSPEVERRVAGVQLQVKLELFQRGGTFKIRGALLNAMALDADGRERGVCAVSAGNHAIAVALAASSVGTTAKVVMPESADPFRVAACRAAGGEVVSTPDVHRCFEEVERIRDEEGRTFIHPFEGERTLTGTATLGAEWLGQADRLDAVILPIGGGGLAGGAASAIKQLAPDIRIYGVEPAGADSMHRSRAAGEPVGIERVATIADSLGAPHAAPLSFALCERYVDELVMVDDDMLREAMRLIHAELKFAVEPACAATTAALIGPLANRLQHQRVGVLFCGSNVGPEGWAQLARPY